MRQIMTPLDLPTQECRATHPPPSEQETCDRLPLKLLGMDQANATVDLRIDAGVSAGSELDLGVDIRITVPDRFPHAVPQLEVIEAWGNGGALARRMSEAVVAQCRVRLEADFARRPEKEIDLPAALADLHNKLRSLSGKCSLCQEILIPENGGEGTEAIVEVDPVEAHRSERGWAPVHGGGIDQARCGLFFRVLGF